MIYSNSASHWYYRDGRPAYDKTLREARKEPIVPSVTTILKVIGKPELDAWKQRELLAAAVSTPRTRGQTDEAYARTIVDIYDAKQGEAAKRGTAIHDELEAWLKGTARAGFSTQAIAAKNMLDDHGCKAALCEQSFAHTDGSHGYGGRIDLICELDDGLAIIDYKTQGIKLDKKGNPKHTTYDEWAMQLAAYRQWYCKRARCYNLIIGTNIEYTYLHEWSDEELERGWQMFRNCLDLFYLIKRL
jgi:hypothetical protein